jgi:hypothetical protein
VSGTRRPAGGEDNILARLERDGVHGTAGGSTAGGRRALFALGCLVVLGLVGTLTWLAYQNATTKRVLPGAAVSAAPAASALPVPAQAALDPSEQIVPAHQLTAPADSVSQTEAPASVKPDEAGVPTLVLLPPERRADAKPAPVIAAPQAAARALVAARKAPPVLAAGPKAEPQQVDTDVALLSAIIMHASSHAAERAQLEAQACAQGKKCPARAEAPAPKLAD